MDSIITNVIQTITGGMIPDVVFVITALVFMSLVLVGFDWIKRLFDEQLNNWSDSRADSRMDDIGYLNRMKRQSVKYRGTAEGDVYQYQYKKAFKQYIHHEGHDRD